jgi:hypothetical protein
MTILRLKQLEHCYEYLHNVLILHYTERPEGLAGKFEIRNI